MDTWYRCVSFIQLLDKIWCNRKKRRFTLDDYQITQKIVKISNLIIRFGQSS